MGPTEAVWMLERRAAVLEKRIAADARDLTWDKSELAALRWALGQIGSSYFDRLMIWCRVARIYCAEVLLIGRRDEPEKMDPWLFASGDAIQVTRRLNPPPQGSAP